MRSSAKVKLKRAPLYRHEVWTMRLCRRRDLSLYLRRGRRLCLVVGKLRLRAWILARYRRLQAAWDGGQCIGFRLIGSPNRRMYCVFRITGPEGRRHIGASIVRGTYFHCGRTGPLCYSHEPGPCRRIHQYGGLCAASCRRSEA